ncbi:MAG: hypothetical protein JNK64_14215 [Myxococcales bacterium]|nr:hypothetical protein [Myxococcales bacterium]
MKVYELARQLKMPSTALVPYLVSAGVKKTHHLTPLTADQIAKVRAAVVRDRSRLATASTAPAALSVKPAPPLLAFGSLKGGVGKTTTSLCAAELLRTVAPRWPVVVVDADVAGTELDWVWNESSHSTRGRATYQVSGSLVELLEERPDSHRDGPLDALKSIATDLANDKDPERRGLVVPTFAQGTEGTIEALEWKRVLETSSAYVRRNLARVLRALRECQVAIVVDLPAFDVGFAHFARQAVEDAKGTFYWVTDCDIRTLRATISYLGVHAATLGDDRWQHVVVNGVDDAREPSSFWRMVSRATNLRIPPTPSKPQAGPVLVARADSIRNATNADRDNEDTELFNAIEALIKGASLSRDAPRRLRGEEP